MELAAVCKKRQFHLENLTTNNTLKQSKSNEINKDLILILPYKKTPRSSLILPYEKTPRSGSNPTNLSRERKGEKNIMCF
jgi:hypothetical protein